ncbi:Na+-transporting NADH:ubiquinone oxidoreductase subunit A [Draconibacterium orientale]|uniref:Na(+)-translocating NADH-quinone reductase subunit A n=1 Tax=Draconibacterium orientale TaxID=1168034 RepID=X5E439_9BACT|nr:Na(+)-translocating NADH-quinone reductase subunit A [Draconibacterium orientale]AHW61361.1 Na(+)-translocating NADH-quinone reductase subunit A [Draconibacterium orientale]SET90632.1 Na+-transporting NADH:ubiquinone oxidoreductase subunit A [Draconibacterium orientale]
MSEVIKLRKGLNIKLKGSAEKALDKLPVPATVALKPTDFPGLTPKLSVKVDAEVKAGDALFYDKYHPEILFTAPLGGKVVSINRGERRKILEVVIATDEKIGSAEFKKADPSTLSAEEVKEQILKSGLWPFIKKRPYGIIANPEEKPKAIYISTFDTAPLAPDYNFVIDGQMDTFQTGVNALAQLTEGKVNLGVSKDSAFTSLKNVVVNTFEGPHPAGNVGIQIANTSPINKGEVVWTINVQDVLFIGRLFETGKVDFTKAVALTGSEVKTPKYYQTTLGAPVATIVGGKLVEADYNQRIISGNVLTGTKVSEKSYVGFYDSHISVIPEGDEYEFLGWADPGFNKFSATKAYFGKLFPKKEYTMNANIHGGERAFVLSNQYEKLVPMDILPVYLLKAILVNDLDKMENFGIYEVIEEDFALCEYACTSKIEVQKILREGINTMIKELG